MGERRPVENELSWLDAFDVDHGNDAAHDRRKLGKPGGIEIVAGERCIGCSESAAAGLEKPPAPQPILADGPPVRSAWTCRSPDPKPSATHLWLPAWHRVPASPLLALAELFLRKLNDAGQTSRQELIDMAVKEGFFPDAETAAQGVRSI